MHELLRVLGVTKQALNGPLRDLYAQRLITWERDPDDARVKRLSLTRAGRALEARLSNLQRGQFRTVFGAGGPADADGWMAVMRRLAESESKRSGRVLPSGSLPPPSR